MWSPDPTAQAAALQQLRVLTRGDTECAAQAREAVMVGLGAVVSILSSNSSNQGMQIHAAALLRDVACTDRNSARVVAAPGCLTGLVGLLSSRDFGVQEAAVHALGKLAYGQERKTVRQAIVNVSGCLPALVGLLRSFNVSVQEAAAGALGNLAYEQGNKQAIANVSGCLPALVGLLRRSNVSVQEAAASAPGNLAYQQRNNQQAIANVPGCLPALVALLTSDDARVLETAAGAL